MSRILSVRLDEELYTRCIQSEVPRGTLVKQALMQYFSRGAHAETYTPVNNSEVVELLRSHNSFLQSELDRVHNELSAVMVSRSSLLQRVVYRLRGS